MFWSPARYTTRLCRGGKHWTGELVFSARFPYLVVYCRSAGWAFVRWPPSGCFPVVTAWRTAQRPYSCALAIVCLAQHISSVTFWQAANVRGDFWPWFLVPHADFLVGGMQELGQNRPCWGRKNKFRIEQFVHRSGRFNFFSITERARECFNASLGTRWYYWHEFWKCCIVAGHGCNEVVGKERRPKKGRHKKEWDVWVQVVGWFQVRVVPRRLDSPHLETPFSHLDYVLHSHGYPNSCASPAQTSWSSICMWG